MRAVPLILIGLGIAVAFRGGALNIGAEGQFYAGAIAATWVGLHLAGQPRPVAPWRWLWLAAAVAGLRLGGRSGLAEAPVWRASR